MDLERTITFALPLHVESVQVASILESHKAKVQVVDRFDFTENEKPLRAITYKLAFANEDGSRSADSVNQILQTCIEVVLGRLEVAKAGGLEGGHHLHLAIPLEVLGILNGVVGVGQAAHDGVVHELEGPGNGGGEDGRQGGVDVREKVCDCGFERLDIRLASDASRRFEDMRFTRMQAKASSLRRPPVHPPLERLWSS